MVTYFCDKGHILPLSQIQTEEEWLQCAADAGYEETQVAVALQNEQMDPKEDLKLSSQPKKLESQNENAITGPKKPPKPQKKSKLEKKLEKLALEKQKESEEAEKGLDLKFHILYCESYNMNHVKVGCVFPMVVVSIPPHSAFGPNDYQEDASHFI